MELKIINLERDAVTGGVRIVHWSLSKTLDDISEYVYGAESFNADPTSPTFIPFEQLTESVVIGWVMESLGEQRLSELESVLDKQIQNKLTPAIIAGKPW